MTSKGRMTKRKRFFEELNDLQHELTEAAVDQHQHCQQNENEGTSGLNIYDKHTRTDEENSNSITMYEANETTTGNYK